MWIHQPTDLAQKVLVSGVGTHLITLVKNSADLDAHQLIRSGNSAISLAKALKHTSPKFWANPNPSVNDLNTGDRSGVRGLKYKARGGTIF